MALGIVEEMVLTWGKEVRMREEERDGRDVNDNSVTGLDAWFALSWKLLHKKGRRQDWLPGMGLG